MGATGRAGAAVSALHDLILVLPDGARLEVDHPTGEPRLYVLAVRLPDAGLRASVRLALHPILRLRPAVCAEEIDRAADAILHDPRFEGVT